MRDGTCAKGGARAEREPVALSGIDLGREFSMVVFRGRVARVLELKSKLAFSFLLTFLEYILHTDLAGEGIRIKP